MPFLTYVSKWDSGCEEFKSLAPHVQKLDAKLEKKIIDICKKVSKILKCKNYFRVDLRERNNQFFVIDVNPNPDISIDSGFMRAAYFNGYAYEQVIEAITELAFKK